MQHGRLAVGAAAALNVSTWAGCPCRSTGVSPWEQQRHSKSAHGQDAHATDLSTAELIPLSPRGFSI